MAEAVAVAEAAEALVEAEAVAEASAAVLEADAARQVEEAAGLAAEALEAVGSVREVNPIVRTIIMVTHPYLSPAAAEVTDMVRTDAAAAAVCLFPL